MWREGVGAAKAGRRAPIIPPARRRHETRGQESAARTSYFLAYRSPRPAPSPSGQ